MGSESAPLPLSVAPTPEIATGDSTREDLKALLLSVNNTIKRIANTTRRVHPAAEELQILHDIESRINASHADNLSTLRFRRNQLTHINGLPDEILLMIFLYAENTKIRREMLKYLPLTWICRRWRFLAMNSPVLWKLLDYSCRKDDVLEEIVRRSKGTKILAGLLGTRFSESRPSGIMGWSENYCDYFDKYSDLVFGNFKRYIIPILSHVEVLDVSMKEKNLPDGLLPLQENLSPSIRRCRLHMYGTKSESALAELIFSKIFNSQTLEVLEIHSDYLSFSQIAAEPQVPNLQHLVLSSEKSPPDLPDLQDLLRILQSCSSSLETLEILTSHKRSSPPLLRPRINMTHLTTIRLSNPADAQILEYISTPALQMLDLDGRDMSQISPLAYFETLPVMILGDFCVEGYKEKDADGNHKLGLKMDFRPRYGGEEMLPSLIPHFVKWANHLTWLRLKGGTMWLQLILEHAHMLRDLHIGFDCEEIFPLLEDPATCPQLESFTYACWEGKPGRQLLYIVRLRHKSGAPLKHLKLTINAKHPVARTHVEKLKELVDFELCLVKK